ncbi:epithelial chloride channel protein-like protein [Anopheles sinensis]|uniref:Epithelial chloride channel protein-like protein n=1 Tax=Anopheles sinensis TaxID=74873 RepID=A0A084VTD1_ANOSI|nr:epithelial chloride channel protein-like protein [Anopheles sinensis]
MARTLAFPLPLLLVAAMLGLGVPLANGASSITVEKSAYKNVVIEIRDNVPVDNCQTILQNLETDCTKNVNSHLSYNVDLCPGVRLVAYGAASVIRPPFGGTSVPSVPDHHTCHIPPNARDTNECVARSNGNVIPTNRGQVAIIGVWDGREAHFRCDTKPEARCKSTGISLEHARRRCTIAASGFPVL